MTPKKKPHSITNKSWWLLSQQPLSCSSWVAVEWISRRGFVGIFTRAKHISIVLVNVSVCWTFRKSQVSALVVLRKNIWCLEQKGLSAKKIFHQNRCLHYRLLQFDRKETYHPALDTLNTSWGLVLLGHIFEGLQVILLSAGVLMSRAQSNMNKIPSCRSSGLVGMQCGIFGTLFYLRFVHST